MNPGVFITLSLLLVLLVTTTASQTVAVGEGVDDNGVMNKCWDEERHALLHFKASVQDPYDTLSTWIADEYECCKWRGVTCNNQTGHVTRLDIAGCSLGGEISHSLVNLTYLNYLDLHLNSFRGTIPSFIGSMTRLSYLDLKRNEFNGIIPRSIGSITQLRYLDLSYNSLNGTIPPEFGNLTNLQQLSIGFAGRCRVENLEWLSHLSHLEQLRMDGISLAKQNHW